MEECHGRKAATLFLLQFVTTVTIPIDHLGLNAAEAFCRISHASTVSGIEEP